MNKPIPGMNRKKCCMFCGCHLAPYAESDICEVCFDERYYNCEDDLEEVISCDECFYL